MRKARQYAGGIERKPDSRTYELRARQLMDEFRQTEYIGWNDLRESQKYAGCFERKPEVRRIRLRESQITDRWMS